MNPDFASNRVRYVKSDYCFCPYCDGLYIRADDLKDEGITAWRKVDCMDCDKSWNEIYTMTDIEERS